MAVITISRQVGSLGDELASYLSSKLNCAIIDRAHIMEILSASCPPDEINKLNDSAKAFNNIIPDKEITYKELMISKIDSIIEEANTNNSDVIIVGLGGVVFAKNYKDVLNIRISASEATRQKRLMKKFQIDSGEAENLISIGDKKHKRFVSLLWNRDLSDSSLYDLSLNTDNLSIEECAEGILSLLEKKKMRSLITKEVEETTDVINHQTVTPVFKNESEAEFARILDLYHIEWMYEPKTFPIEWDLEGNIISAFSPDFYLPKFNLYLELTTMEQKYVNKKKKKAQKCMELYPGTNVRIVYKRDFEELVERLSKFN